MYKYVHIETNTPLDANFLQKSASVLRARCIESGRVGSELEGSGLATVRAKAHEPVQLPIRGVQPKVQVSVPDIETGHAVARACPRHLLQMSLKE
eukprot:SAG22_NODE_1200_length_5182_cov_4.342514_3_plen_95_part_00